MTSDHDDRAAATDLQSDIDLAVDRLADEMGVSARIAEPEVAAILRRSVSVREALDIAMGLQWSDTYKELRGITWRDCLEAGAVLADGSSRRDTAVKMLISDEGCDRDRAVAEVEAILMDAGDHGRALDLAFEIRWSELQAAGATSTRSWRDCLIAGAAGARRRER